ncbi:hypothetical protein WOLCODRAFT_62791 [Wolfiporia cocos MD-104 SS10]|uniref:Uncharacterized protein n=1 Tax=Wolfiporia cocos (strain MD-104) TaxID=742152 RepID=A0A2H3J6Z4_WOLCO|nr:hypothetical protein WOLCODRAFT_62791 [Wolfiporia cocos MD-104 SS10]
MDEIKRYLEFGHFDMFPLIGTFRKRDRFWQDDVAKSKQEQPCRQIIIAIHNAVKSDAAEIFDLQSPYRLVLKNHRHNAKDSTIYGHTFCMAFFDKIHAARTVSRLFASFAEVRSSCQAGFMVGMMATPLLSLPTDIWSLGYILGVRECDPEHIEYRQKVDRDLGSHLHGDRHRLKESSKAEEILSRITHSQSLSVSSEYLEAMNKSMDEMRTAFHSHIIQRTLKSTDWEDNPISGLRPYHEHLIIRSLFKFEEKALEDVTRELADNDAAKKAGDLFIAKGKVSS